MSKNTAKIEILQQRENSIRNICILAHVDHGKTTLADHLIANNGIISARNAGTMCYLDNRPDEQERKITMKASNISLYHADNESNEYLINLIDSPGHVDFSSEASAAVRLADGAIIVIDVVEGVCAQTRTILQQAYNENLKLILFINKIDRLVIERKMSLTDADDCIKKLVETVNAVIGNMFATSVIANEDASSENQESALEKSDDSNLYFDPLKGNVIFGSAIDGWALTTKKIARMYAQRMALNEREFHEALFKDQYYNHKTKTCHKLAYAKGKDNLFTSLILTCIFKMYNNILDNDFKAIPDFLSKVGLSYRPPKHATESHRRSILRAAFKEWMPLDQVFLETIVEQVTSPIETYVIKLSKLMSLSATQQPEIKFSDDDESQIIAYIAKMVPIPYRELQACDKSLKNETDEFESDELILIAFVRVFKGIIKPNGKAHIVLKGYSRKEKNISELKPVTVRRVYLMMGRNFEPISEAHPGMIVGIWYSEKHEIKTGALTTSYDCPPFCGLDILAPPVVRVAVEPMNIDQMPILLKGLKILNQVDSSVQIMIQETGEHVLCVLGEVHLEKCIRDLKDSYSCIELKVSKPIVQFRETIVDVPKSKEIFDEEKTATIQARNGSCHIKMIALPLPAEVVQIMENNKDELKVLMDKVEGDASNDVVINKDFNEFRSSLAKLMNTSLDGIIVDNEIWSMGPKKLSTCMLLNKSDYSHHDFWNSTAATGPYDRAIINGFQSAVSAGPLCNEPMHGVCFVMLKFDVDESFENSGTSLSGTIITAVKDACLLAFKKQGQRLVSPMYNLNVFMRHDVLGKCFAEVSKRNGKVLVSDEIAGSGMWIVDASVPVVESFDFANQLRVKTSGLAMPQLKFSHWETIEEDPFWIPTTAEELEKFGDKADFENKAKGYMDSIRERKGLYVDKKLVEFGEKQRTLSKNK